ncbi:MAG: GNAT family N-acetyltransferase [Pseudomonadales bacterium]|nr:GNAT family N-acetyltransferase [Pseudomonadales bacterium]
MHLRFITLEDDLAELAHRINVADWDEGNEIEMYSAESLAAYLQHEDVYLLVCEVSAQNTEVMGMASGRVLHKPYGRNRWLYVDEVDVCVPHRQKGAGKAMMNALLQLAANRGCNDVWLGTETDNVAANALYRSLKPADAEQFIGYAWELSPE